ncbi:MAG: aminotransferase class I/II-fold pyridoxal phosphate-dependent enzyme [Bacteroidia bacterium]
MDIFEKLTHQMSRDLGKYAEVGHGFLAFPKLEGEIGPWMYYQGQRVLVWSLNNYLGLANHPQVREADAQAAQKYGLAYPMGSRMLTGNTDAHEALEKELAAFVRKEDVYLLNYGYQGFLSVLDALLDRHDVVIYDQLAHACLIDGMRLTPAKRFSYPHNDISVLEKRLQAATQWVEKTGGGILVVTEGVFGMRGDLGRLDAIAQLKGKYAFRLVVDDAHGFGVMGAHGRGVAEHYGVEEAVDLLMSTFAKSMALIGAFVAGPKAVVDYLRYHARSQIYAKSLPLPIVEGARVRLRLLQEPQFHARLWEVTRALQEGLVQAGFDIGDTQSPVTPVYLYGGEDEAIALVHDLRKTYKIFCSVVAYPVVEKGKIILRLIPTAVHTSEDVKYTIEVFKEVARKLREGAYQNARYLAR